MADIRRKNRFVWHCTAGFAGVTAIERFWREDLKWKHKGYATITELDGTIWWLKDNSAVNGYTKEYTDACWNFTTNGVSGYNSQCIHHSLIGGVEKVGNIWVAKDTRTPEQIEAMHYICQKGIEYLTSQGVDVTKDFGTYGHREFSPDQNGDGVVSSWERIKECPSFPVMGTCFHHLYSSKDRQGKLPYLK